MDGKKNYTYEKITIYPKEENLKFYKNLCYNISWLAVRRQGKTERKITDERSCRTDQRGHPQRSGNIYAYTKGLRTEFWLSA